MIKEEHIAIEEAKKLIKEYSPMKHLIKHLENIEDIITVIDTQATFEEGKVVLIPKGAFSLPTRLNMMKKQGIMNSIYEVTIKLFQKTK